MSSIDETTSLTCIDLPSSEQAELKTKLRRKTNEGKSLVDKIPNHYKGVTKHKTSGRFEAHLWDKNSMSVNQKKKGRQVYLGAHNNEEDAARTHDLATLKYYGPTAILNFPVSTYIEEYKKMQRMSNEEYLGILRRQTSGFARGVSKYRGVARQHRNGQWEARIGNSDGESEAEAAVAYDRASVKLKGFKAKTNFDIRGYIRSTPSNSSPPSPLPVYEPIEVLESQVPREAQFPTQMQPGIVHDSKMLDPIDESPWNLGMDSSLIHIPANISRNLPDMFSENDVEELVAQYMYGGNNTCKGMGSHDLTRKETGIDLNITYEESDGLEGDENALSGVAQRECGSSSIGKMG